MKEIKERLKFNIDENKNIVFNIKKANNNVPRHWHNYFELEIIISGSGKEIICGKECDIFPGCCYLLSMEDYHSVEIYEELEILQLIFDESYLTKEQLERILTKKSLPFSVLEGSNFEIIKSLYYVAKREYDEFSVKSACLRKMTECLITKVLDSFMMTENLRYDNIPKSLKSSVLYIHTHFQKPITLDEVAAVAKYNPSYFSSTFKSELGVSFSEYISNLRINYAKQLLLFTDEGIKQIGKCCGFLSPSTFLQAFKKQEGITPTFFRKQNSNK